MTDNFEIPQSSEAVSLPDELRVLRFEWKDEIPTEKIDSTAEDRRYKVRGAWFESVSNVIGMMEFEGSLDDEESKKSAKEFYDRFTNEEFKQRLTTEEDISIANKCIDTILEHV